MSTALPDDVDTLKEIILGKDSAIAELQKRNALLLERVTLLEKYRFARSSERWTDEDRRQLYIFNEAEFGAPPDIPEPPDTEEISYTRKKKKSKGRKPLSDDLPRNVIVHGLSEEQRRCQIEGCPRYDTCKNLRPEIGEQTREELEFIPAQIIVNHHVYKSYGEIACETVAEDESVSAVISAPREKRIIPRGIVTASLLAYIVASKFADALPLYRLERILRRIGVDISRQTMCGWVIAAAMACEAYLDLLRWHIRAGPLINMDETTVQVLHEPNRAAEQKSCMWVMVGSEGNGRRIVLYHYAQTKAAEVAEALLEDYRGVLQTDGCPSYNTVGAREDIYHVGCMAHARRKFYEAYIGANKQGKAITALRYIKDLYRIDRELREQPLSDRQFVKQRRKAAVPILRAFRKWLAAMSEHVLPESLLGKAVSYALEQYRRIVRYLKYAYVTPDNNIAEVAIRPFVVGRRYAQFRIMLS
ncbi:MAG: IS66 family transposase [Planctomycetota bacterium]